MEKQWKQGNGKTLKTGAWKTSENRGMENRRKQGHRKLLKTITWISLNQQSECKK
jgi:hypothetical protein